MDLHMPFSLLFYLNIFILVECTFHSFLPIRQNPIISAIVNFYCGIAEAPIEYPNPLLFSPWMVVLTYRSAKGRETVLNCGATLISGKHAITSDACLKKGEGMPFNAIFGAPSLQHLNMGTKKPIQKISYLLSDNRIAVLQFLYVIFTSNIRPICLDKSDLTGISATVGYNHDNNVQEGSHRFGKKVAYLKLKDYCRTNGLCAEVLPVEESWEMDASEVQEGAPLLIEVGSYWYIKGIMMDTTTDSKDKNKGGTLKPTKKPKKTKIKNTENDNKNEKGKGTGEQNKNIKEKSSEKNNENKKDEVSNKEKKNKKDKGVEKENVNNERNDNDENNKNKKKEGTKNESGNEEDQETKKESEINKDEITMEDDENEENQGKEEESGTDKVEGTTVETENDEHQDTGEEIENNKEEGTETDAKTEADNVTDNEGENHFEENEEIAADADQSDSAEKEAVQTRKRKRAVLGDKKENNYDLFFIKLTSHVVDELEQMFTVFNY